MVVIFNKYKGYIIGFAVFLILWWWLSPLVTEYIRMTTSKKEILANKAVILDKTKVLIAQNSLLKHQNDSIILILSKLIAKSDEIKARILYRNSHFIINDRKQLEVLLSNHFDSIRQNHIDY